MSGQIVQPGSFDTARAANPLYCHQEFLEKLQEFRAQPVGKRASLLMQRLAVDETRQHFKATHGPNRGWRRSRLGGNQGSQFYAWWAPASAAPLREGIGFSELPHGAIVLRDIRHHDDHSPATPQSLQEHYLPVSIADLRNDEFGPEPWTQPQVKFASARANVRTLKGHPGSGKTTALLHAADSTRAEHVLYVTFSRDLVNVARLHFDRFCSKDRHFHVTTFDTFLRDLLHDDSPRIADSESRRKFQSDLYPFARHIAPWNEHLPALWDEFHAHVIGAAVPVDIGRFEGVKRPRVNDRNYRERRARFLGHSASVAVMEAAGRLERLNSEPLANRYFPELALAWRAAAGMGHDPSQLEAWSRFGCIAIDECQDLTPVEAFVLVALAGGISKLRRRPISLLVAGDEAQTVRATDFEWGWMNDILHTILATPSEFKLTSNLRSPQRIAGLVNRVWDLYDYLDKKDRPSGTGYATIDDDANDQVLYCTASPGAELDDLLTNLASREGLALISMDDVVPAAVPESLRANVLSTAEAKGLDFHSVCLLNAGPQLERIGRPRERYDTQEIESLRKRLAIDRLRVALSRPTDRLIWLDISPSPYTVSNSIEFLKWGSLLGRVSPCIPAALLQNFEEEQFDNEERIQRCLADARQYLNVKPDLAWSRAQQAVGLLGVTGSASVIVDAALQTLTYTTLAEICFCLAARRVRLAPHLGSPNLFSEAYRAAYCCQRYGLGTILSGIERAFDAPADDHISALTEMAEAFARHRDELMPWVITEIADRARGWVDELEAAVAYSQRAAVMGEILPPFYDALGLPDAEERKQRLRTRSIQVLLKNKHYEAALAVLRQAPERDYRQEAQCYDALALYREAGEAYRAAGDLKEAIRCYRSIPDFAAAFELIRQVPGHAAAESYEWLQRLNALIEQKPEKFNRVMLAPEKKLLEESLERALGVVRKKAATGKPAAKKTTVKKAARKDTAPVTVVRRKRTLLRRPPDDNDPF